MLLLWGSSSAAPGSPLAAALAAALGTTITPTGTVGATLTRYTAPVAPHGTRVLVFLGANDPATLDRARAMREVTSDLRTRGLAPIWLPLPAYSAAPMRMRADAHAAVLASGQAGQHYGPGPVLLPEGWDRGDGIHFSATGAAAYANSIARSRSRAGAIVGCAALAALAWAAW